MPHKVFHVGIRGIAHFGFQELKSRYCPATRVWYWGGFILLCGLKTGVRPFFLILVRCVLTMF